MRNPARTCLQLLCVPLAVTVGVAGHGQALHESLQETPGECSFAKAKTSSQLEELQAFLDEAVADCTEGLMVKAMDATYEPSKRSLNWLKLKKDYMEGAADSFDVVPIGAWCAPPHPYLTPTPSPTLVPQTESSSHRRNCHGDFRPQQ